MSDDPAKPQVAVVGTAPATVVAFPASYFDFPTLNLHFTSAADLSLDDAGAKKFKKKSNTPLTYVKALQADMIQLGYLKAGSDDGMYGGTSKRAVTRFQRHAQRVYRLIGSSKTADDVAAGAVFSGGSTGVVDPATAKEIQTWKAKGWVNPVGRFELTALAANGKLRKDAAAAWDAMVTSVTGKGGLIASPYSDVPRPISFKPPSSAASAYSFHYCGRAVDISWNRRYFIAKDPSGTDLFWRIHCKTDKQDGTQGVKLAKGAVKCFDFLGKKQFDIPEGHYLDITAECAAGNFERIKAHDDWETNPKASEWWHFQFTLDKQPTFLDEMELIGFTEAQLRAAGWDTDAALDHAPG